MKKLILLSLLSFNLIQTSENNDTQALEKEYNQCIQEAKDNLWDSAKVNLSFLGTEWNWKPHTSPNGSNSHRDHWIQSRFNQQCNKCLATYVLRALKFIK